MRRIRLPSLAVLAFVALPVLGVQASTIDFSTRSYGGGYQTDAGSYQSVVEGLMSTPATAGYGDATPVVFNNLSNQSVFGGPASSIAFKDTVGFSVASAGTWSFRLGPDFGLGGAIFLDGSPMVSQSRDLWWGYNWASGDVLQFTAALGAGNHTLTVYGVENCCDGGQTFQFMSAGSSNYTTFSTTDGVSPVPLPAALPMFGAALVGLGGLARRRAKKSA